LQRIVFVCSQNKLRSPTAEQIYASRPDLEVSSAGTNNDAENPLTAELIDWAGTIFVMEKTHLQKIRRRFKRHLSGKRLICLDIPDDFGFMDAALVALLKRKLAPFLGAA